MKALTFLLVFISLNLQAQYYENVDSVPGTKEKKKAARALENQKQYEQMLQLVESRKFVLEADYLSDSKGLRIPVTSNLNFILVDSARGVLQVGSNAGMGSNGVGGVTAEGDVQRWRVTTNEKRKSISVDYTLLTHTGPYDVMLFVSPGGYTTGWISGIRGGKLMYDGKLIPRNRSRVFKGHSL
jgi:hypothetical protein